MPMVTRAPATRLAWLGLCAHAKVIRNYLLLHAAHRGRKMAGETTSCVAHRDAVDGPASLTIRGISNASAGQWISDECTWRDHSEQGSDADCAMWSSLAPMSPGSFSRPSFWTEIIVHIAPVLVGGGVRFFERAGGAPIRLEAISSHVEGETTVLHYGVQKTPGDDGEAPQRAINTLALWRRPGQVPGSGVNSVEFSQRR